MTISSLTLRYLPGELQDAQNSTVTFVKIVDYKEDLSSQNNYFIEESNEEKKNDFHEEVEEERLDERSEEMIESDEERFKRIGNRQKERIENLKKFCQEDWRLQSTKASVWFRKG